MLVQRTLALQLGEATEFLEKTAELLADITIKTIKLASKTVAVETLQPIKKERPVFKFKVPIKDIEIPNELVERGDVKPIDREDETIVDTANNAIENLQDMRKVFKSSPDQMGVALRESQIAIANRALRIAQDNRQYVESARTRFLFGPKEFYDKAIDDRLRSEEEILATISRGCLDKMKKIQESLSVANVDQARNIIIIDILRLSESGLDAADHLIVMLNFRRASSH